MAAKPSGMSPGLRRHENESLVGFFIFSQHRHLGPSSLLIQETLQVQLRPFHRRLILAATGPHAEEKQVAFTGTECSVSPFSPLPTLLHSLPPPLKCERDREPPVRVQQCTCNVR